MEVGEEPVDGAELVSGRDEQIGGSGPGRPCEASSVRSAVVPTAITRPARAMARADSSGTK